MKLAIFSIFLAAALVFYLGDGYAQTQSVNSTNATTQAEIMQSFYKQGNDLFQQGKYQDAISYYDKALEINTTNTKVLYNKALALDQLGKIEDALSYYDKVLAITPNDTSTLYNKAYDLSDLGKYDQAISYYKMVLAITPNDTGSLNNIGINLDNLGRHDEALSYYDKALSISPNDTAVLYNEGVEFDTMGKHDKALPYYERVLAIDPTNVGALNKMNLTYNNINKTQLADLQRTDKTSLIVVTLFIAIASAIIIIDIMAKRKQQYHSKTEAQIIDKINKKDSMPTNQPKDADKELPKIQKEAYIMIQQRPQEEKKNVWESIDKILEEKKKSIHSSG